MLWSVYVTCVTIIRNHTLKQLLVSVLPCCCYWCLVQQFIEFISARIASYTVHVAANFLAVGVRSGVKLAASIPRPTLHTKENN